MADPPFASPWRSLAAWIAAAGLLLTVCGPAMAATPRERVAAAGGLYFQGKSVSARRALTQLLDDPALTDPADRRIALESLLDICIRTYAAECTVRYAGKYLEAFPAFPVANAVQKRELARKAIYYVEYGEFLVGSKEEAARILAAPNYGQENSANAEAYIRRQLLTAYLLLKCSRKVEAERAIDKVLSLVASLKNPQAARLTVAWALADSIDMLDALGETERAYGVYRATVGFVVKTLPPLSADAATFHLTEAQLLQEVGSLRGSVLATDIASRALRTIELDPDVAERLLAQALTLKAAVCTAQAQTACAQDALRQHPYAGRYARPGAAARSPQEVTYLAARALAAAAGGKGDPVAAQALQAAAAGDTDMTEIYRASGAALALPAGAPRLAGLADAGRQMARLAGAPSDGPFGAWYRPGAIDQIVIALAVGQGGEAWADSDDIAFALFQLAGRRGASFDADAMTALAQAGDEAQRRAIHQALRLRARRDRLERAQLQAVTLQADSAAPESGWLQHDVQARWRLRDFSVRIGDASRGLTGDGVAASGSNIVSLKRFQAVLGPNEVALSVTTTPGGIAYLCVRRDAVQRKTAPADISALQVDIRVIQAALTAGHAPSEALDSQFPAAASVRLYDALIRPFDGCLRAGDPILWLPNMSLTAFPLAVLLERAPPRLGGGYDLAAADWLVKRHPISYVGSAGVVVAARTGGARTAGDFDFLGVGDPLLSGATANGEDRAKILLHGARLTDLAPLPETKAELNQSAEGFRNARVLTQGDATEGALRNQLLGSYGLLSFATHGLLRNDLQGLSDPALVLTPVSAATPWNDGLLTASEIADLTLSARFVALSACNTANFDLTQMSAELPALASAFAVAGVPATLATLWPVDSETSRQVVAATFGRLREGEDPALALAAAQRAFLSAPPGRAYLHPRFWAPFVVLGDGGGRAPSAQDGLLVTAMETLTQRGGEVVALARSDQRILARFISDRDAQDRHGAGTRASGAAGVPWRRDTAGVGATRFLAEIGSRVLAGGYAHGPDGRAIPAIEVFERASGASVTTWRGAASPGLSGFVVGGAALDSHRAVVAVAQLNFDADAPGRRPRLDILEVDATIKPRLLFAVEPAARMAIDAATVTPLGGALLITYTERYPPGQRDAAAVEDDFDRPLCTSLPTTWLELRDARTGRMLAAKALPGWTAAAALRREGQVVVGGAFKASCTAEARAAVFSVDAALDPHPLFNDATLGASEVKALAAMATGETVLAASKEDVFDYRAQSNGKPMAAAYGIDEPPVKLGALLVTLAPDGKASASKRLDSGSSIYVSAAEASEAGDILVGGSIGEQAAIFHLARRP